jgi:2-keto-4-pentenoate hydratase/2-oxohepta-3-ene-1,7-dioic acid hydratase in catechol pathway
MKLVTFAHNGQTRLGALTADDAIVDLNRADPQIPADMLAFLAAGDGARVLAQRALTEAPATAVVARGVVTLLAPIPRPGKIICIGLNYREHAAESNQPLPEYPTVFAKYNNTVVGPGAAIVLPTVTEKVDYEAEFAVVIGRTARNVAAADAMSYVAGYTIFNDVSARDYQMRTSQWTVGKTFDTFGPMGPALVTADEISDPHALDISLSINGEVLQSSNTNELIFTINQLIEDLTSYMTLEPGDLISTGTPSGVGQARKPQRWLCAGDIVRVEVAGLGVLENPVAAA